MSSAPTSPFPGSMAALNWACFASGSCFYSRLATFQEFHEIDLVSMKTAIAVLLLFCSLMFAGGNSEKDVLAAIDAWKEAALKGDAAALGKLYHDALAYTHSNAMTQNKTVAI